METFNSEQEQTSLRAGKARDRALPNVDNVELPPERIYWLLTLLELYFHAGTLYAFKLFLNGRVGLPSAVTGMALLQTIGLLNAM